MKHMTITFSDRTAPDGNSRWGTAPEATILLRPVSVKGSLSPSHLNTSEHTLDSTILEDGMQGALRGRDGVEASKDPVKESNVPKGLASEMQRDEVWSKH